MMNHIIAIIVAVISFNTHAVDSTKVATPVKVEKKTQVNTPKVPLTLTKKVLQRQVRSQQLSNLICDDNDDPAGPDELDVQSPYRRPRLVENPNSDQDDVSDQVKTRLLIARVRALEKYREVWAST